MQPLRIIGVEEHLWSASIRDALTSLPHEQHGTVYNDMMVRTLDEWGEPRLRDMDAIGMDMQVLSVTTPAAQVPELTEAVTPAREANNLPARVVATHPERCQAFAAVPTPVPGASVDGLERCARELGHRGAMLHGRTGEKLDHPDFATIFDKAAALAVPIHLHPQRSIQPISYYHSMQGLRETVGRLFAISGWGWYMETAINVIRLVLCGTFERARNLQVILGRRGTKWSSFFLERVDEIFSMLTRGAPRSFAETFVKHFHLAPAGIWSSRCSSTQSPRLGRIASSLRSIARLPCQ